MLLSPEKTIKVQSFIKKTYTEELSDSFLLDQADLVCELMDSHYFATIMFPNTMSENLYYFSNNPEEFNDVYVPLQNKDVLIDTLVNSNAPVFYKDVNKMDIPGKDDFFEPIQKVRPVSDCCYVPIKVQDRLCGFTAVARAGLNNHRYDHNDLEMFQFISSFINDGFIRNLDVPCPEGNQAYLNGKGQVTGAGDSIREVLVSLFGEKFWNDPLSAHTGASKLLKQKLDDFSSYMGRPGTGSIQVRHHDSDYVLELRNLCEPAYRPVFPDEPQIEIRLKQDISKQGPVDLLDLGKFDRRFHFTPREKQIVDCIYRGMSNTDISTSLRISNSTVKKHIWNIYNKVGVDSRTRLIFALAG